MKKLKHWLWWFNKALFGPELVTNPTMAGTYVAGLAPSWEKNGTPTVSEETGVTDGKAQGITDGTSGDLVGQNISYVIGSRYRLTVRCKRLSGSGSGYARILSVVIGASTNVIECSSDDWHTSTYDYTSIATVSSPIRIYAPAGTLVAFDYVSIKEIL